MVTSRGPRRDGGGGRERSDPRRDPEGTDGISQTFRDALLRHEVRGAIVDLLQNRPGMNKNQLSRELDIYVNLLDFHLNRLIKAGIVTTRPAAQGKEVLCFLPRDVHLWEDPDTRILFGRKPTRDVGLFLAENPGCTTKAVADALDCSPVTVRHHLRTLGDHGLVDKLRLSRRVIYQPEEKLRQWVQEIGTHFDRPWEEAPRPGADVPIGETPEGRCQPGDRAPSEP